MAVGFHKNHIRLKTLQVRIEHERRELRSRGDFRGLLSHDEIWVLACIVMREKKERSSIMFYAFRVETAPSTFLTGEDPPRGTFLRITFLLAGLWRKVLNYRIPITRCLTGESGRQERKRRALMPYVNLNQQDVVSPSISKKLKTRMEIGDKRETRCG